MSKLEVDAIEPQSGTTLTLGASGDTVNIASGATITDFTSTGIDDNATSTAITIDSNEVVRIGNTSDTYSPTYTEHMVIGNYNADEDHGITFLSDLDNTFTLGFADDGHSTLRGAIKYSHLNDFMTFHAFADSERMRINNSGSVMIGTTTVATTSGGSSFGNSTFDRKILYLSHSDTSATHRTLANFAANGSTSGSIQSNASSTLYNTSSDYRLKENVSYDFDATTRLKQLKPARFNFIVDANTTVDGFLAHEVSDIVPEAISGTKDETETKEKVVVNSNDRVIAENIEQADWEAGKIPNEEGTSQYPVDSTWEATKVVPVYQGIDQSKLVPLLVKTIQELEARITALENA